MLTRFLAGRAGKLDDHQRRWLRHHLFDGVVYREPRYRDAARWAVRFLTALGSLEAARTLSTLRRFHEVPAGDKVQLIDRLAA